MNHIEIYDAADLKCPKCGAFLSNDTQMLVDDSLHEEGIKSGKCWCGWEGTFNLIKREACITLK